ncbi:BZ3501_MvSof-1269-A2-R1_Chr7-1g08779 [Microbotryum saponariae]|nr:BZ3501_MvSof-1269-A2-R1_Chr7-1g08779 [Microbotryum saponariae]
MRSSIIVLFTAMVGLVVAAGGDSHHPPGQSHTNGKKKDPQALKQCNAPVIRIGPHSHERETVQLPELSK